MHSWRWFPAVLACLAIWPLTVSAESALQRIQQQGVLRVCIVPQYYGITYRDPRTLQLGGIDIDMSKALAQDLGVQLRHVELTFPKLIAAVRDDLCDVAMVALAITPERQQQLAFTRPYLRSGLHAVTTRAHRRIKAWDDIDTPGIKVGVPMGTFVEQAARHALKQAEVVVVRPDTHRTRELESGRLDAYLADLPDSRRIASESDWIQVLTPTTPWAPLPRGYATRQGDAAWLARLNHFVESIQRDGRLRAAARQQQLTELLLPEAAP